MIKRHVCQAQMCHLGFDFGNVDVSVFSKIPVHSVSTDNNKTRRGITFSPSSVPGSRNHLRFALQEKTEDPYSHLEAVDLDSSFL